MPMKLRLEHEFAEAIEKWGWRYHHIGIPTNHKINGERYLPQFGMYISGFSTSPYGVEWIRFDQDSSIDKLIQNVAHVAFVVDDLDYELRERNLNVITPPNLPMEGVRVAMIEHNGAPIELMEFK